MEDKLSSSATAGSFEKFSTLERLGDFKFKNAFRLSDTGIDSKLITYWRRHGLLPFIEKGNWARLTLMQVLWLRVLSTLRTYHVPLKTLQAVTAYFFERAYLDHLPRLNLLERKENLQKKVVAGTNTRTEEDELQAIDELLQDEVLLYTLKWKVNYFTNLVSTCLESGSEAAIIIFADGTLGEWREGKFFSTSNAAINLERPHLYLPIKHYLEEFFHDEVLNKIISPLAYLNDDEKRVLREMQNRNVQQITITMHDKKVKKVETTTGGFFSEDEVREVKKLLGLRNYESITLSTRDDKHLSFKKTKKEITNSD